MKESSAAVGYGRAKPDFSSVAAVLASGVEEGVFPGAVLTVAAGGHQLFQQGVGCRSLTEDGDSRNGVSVDTVFDVASLTNVLVTTTLIMRLSESRQLNLEDRVSRYLQGFGVLGKSQITVAQLLSHCSGLAHWQPFYEDLLRQNSGQRRGILTSRGAKDFVYNAIARSGLSYEPGTRQVYSDIGFMVLGQLIEMLTGLGLEKAAHRFVFQPLGLKSTSYINLTLIRRRGIHPVKSLIAPTEACPWRKRVLCGEVHDDNAWAMGGIAGHSGVFTTATDLQMFAAELVKAYHGRSEFLKPSTVRHFWSQPSVDRNGSGWLYGWDSPSSENGMAPSKLSESAVGLNSFTGCSLWLEPEQRLSLVLLSNRVHLGRANEKIMAFRPRLADAVLTALKG